MITVSIGGSDRPYLVPGSASISQPKKGRKTASFELFDEAQSYRPEIGSPVILTDGATSFVGLVSAFREIREGGILDVVRYEVQCQDYGAIFDRRFVSRRYPSGSITKNIVEDVIDQFFADEGFDTTNVDGFSTISDELVFDYRSGTEVLNQISDICGEDWWLGGAGGKDLYFKALSSAADAPFDLTDQSPPCNWRDLEISYDSRNYRNRQYVRTGVSLQTGTITETKTGDGVTWLFSTQFVLTAAPTVSVNGIPQTIYELGVDPYPASGWFWIRDGGGVQQGQQTAPSAGATISISYGSYNSNVVMAESSPEQAARAAIEGGSGIWAALDDARDVDNLSTAQALADGLLARSGTMPTTITYETDTAGLEPGMRQTVKLSANGIDTTTSPVSYYYVTQIDSRSIEVPFEVVGGLTRRASTSGWYFRHRVTITNLRDQGNWLNWWLNFYRQAKSSVSSATIAESDSVTINGSPVSYSIPSPYGSELVTNGDFSSGTGWSASGFTISGGKATAAGGYSSLDQTIVAPVGPSYYVTYTIYGRTAGSVYIAVCGAYTTPRSSNGTYSETIASVDTPNSLTVFGVNFTGSVDDVSVREVL